MGERSTFLLPIACLLAACDSPPAPRPERPRPVASPVGASRVRPPRGPSIRGPAVSFSTYSGLSCVRTHEGILCSDGRIDVRCDESDSTGLRCYRVSLDDASGRESLLVTSAPYTDLVIGNGYICVLTRVREVECWGFVTTAGDYAPDHQVVPPCEYWRFCSVPGLPERIAEIDGGPRHMCARTDAGDMYCWGEGIDLAGDPVPDATLAVQVVLPEAIDSLTGGRCAVGRRGRWCVGGAGGRVASLEPPDP